MLAPAPGDAVEVHERCTGLYAALHLLFTQGYLYKRPKRALGRTWQQRFFSLIGSRDNPRLCYSAAEGGEVKGVYQLDQLAGCEVSIGDLKSGKQQAQVRAYCVATARVRGMLRRNSPQRRAPPP